MKMNKTESTNSYRRTFISRVQSFLVSLLKEDLMDGVKLSTKVEISIQVCLKTVSEEDMAT